MIAAPFTVKPDFALRASFVAKPVSLPVSDGVVIRTATIDGKPWECRRYVLARGTVVFCHNIPVTA